MVRTTEWGCCVPDVKAQAKAIKNTKKKDDAPAPPSRDDVDKEMQAVDPRKFVIINPTIPNDKIFESRSETKINYLIQLGLGDMDNITYYRQAISNPKKAITVPQNRKYVAEVLDLLMEAIFKDTQLYTRLVTVLQRNQGPDFNHPKRKIDETKINFELIKKALKGAKNV